MRIDCAVILIIGSSALDTTDVDFVTWIQAQSGVQRSQTSEFDSYVTAFDRGYRTDPAEYLRRKSLFERRVKKVNEQNSKPDRLWTAGLNEFSDFADEEFGGYLGWTGRGSRGAGATAPSLIQVQAEHEAALLSQVSWMHVLEGVPNQGACGSCWAVAATTMLSAHTKIHMQEERNFSVQELVNCVPNPKECGGSGGCQGATAELAMAYILDQGLASDGEVPYTGEAEECEAPSLLDQAMGSKGVKNSRAVKGLTNWMTLPSNKAEPLMRALQAGPVAVAAAANEWQSYSDGIFDGCHEDFVINHAVVIIGYGSEHKQDATVKYWTVQNSWGAWWGENGFIRIKRLATPEEDDAFCGIDNKPEDGIACKPYPNKVTVCGMCGLLYDSVAPKFTSVNKNASSGYLGYR